jgi:hypothetical protein
LLLLKNSPVPLITETNKVKLFSQHKSLSGARKGEGGIMEFEDADMMFRLQVL